MTTPLSNELAGSELAKGVKLISVTIADSFSPIALTAELIYSTVHSDRYARGDCPYGVAARSISQKCVDRKTRNEERNGVQCRGHEFSALTRHYIGKLVCEGFLNGSSPSFPL